MTTQPQSDWKKTACILCSLNCGLEVKIGGEKQRHIVKVRGDKDHPLSQGYLCEKAQRLDYYQNGERLTSPLRRKPDGTFETIDWDTAIREIADKFQAVKTLYGGDKILYYGGGGQGNHLGGVYGYSTLHAIGNKYRSNALAQEKTGEFWVNGKMIGSGVHGDFEHCEVALFIGKNPWQSHGFARARAVIRDIEKDPKRSMIVVDPRRSETAAKADYHLALKPGTDAWCLSAIVAILIQEQLVKSDWVTQHTTGYDEVAPLFASINVSEYAQICGVEESLLRDVAQKIASAESISVFEDLGMQMSVHSTISSYIQRMIWLFTGNFGRQGTNNAPLPFLGVNNLSKGKLSEGKRGKKQSNVSPVAGSKIIIGLIPCNIIPEEILTDHPNRYRAMLIESGNPVHSLANSQKMREALRALELVVVIDVAMTETAREADYILPAASQFEKCETTFFSLEFPKNAFHVRQPLFLPLPGTLPEPEIHARLLERMKVVPPHILPPLKLAAKIGRPAFAVALLATIALNKKLFPYLPVILYRTLGTTLPAGMEAAAVFWAVGHQFVRANSQAVERAGFGKNSLLAAERLFDEILNNLSGVVFAEEDYEASWSRVRHPDNKINLAIPELFDDLRQLSETPLAKNPDFPFILSAGERRSGTSNTIIRNPEWDKKDTTGSLRINPLDAQQLGGSYGDRVRLYTEAGQVETSLEITDMMQTGHISLPNGVGLDYMSADGSIIRKGVAPNELTNSHDRDFLAGTPWHKHIPARLELIAEA